MLRAIIATKLDMASIQQSHFCGPIIDELATRRYQELSFSRCMFSLDCLSCNVRFFVSRVRLFFKKSNVDLCAIGSMKGCRISETI